MLLNVFRGRARERSLSREFNLAVENRFRHGS
jgi:hypothetical protein